jgi:predicted phage terminase large subunit-like protein
MELTSDLIFGFATSLLSERYDEPQPTPDFHRELWGYCCAPDKYVAIAAPRGHAKSTAVTHAYVLASVLFRSADFVVIISDTENQAKQFLGDLKMELSENDKLKELFSIKKFLKDSETDITVQCGDGHKFRIMVRGASGGTGALRGFKWRGKRPNLVVCDDIENDEAVSNEDRRAKFREWMYGALLPVLSDSGKLRFVGTILHFDSLLERLMPQISGDRAKFTRRDGLREWSEDPDSMWKSIKYRAHTGFDDFEEILWPEKFSKERLKSVRDGYSSQGYSEGYAQEYLNYPMSDEAAFFRKDDFLEMTPEDHKKHMLYYASSDFAISSRDKRAYTVFLIAGMDDEGMLHVIKVIRERMEGDQIVEEMLAIQRRYSPEFFVVEKGQIEKSLGPFLKERMFQTNTFINLMLKQPDKDKRSRARSIQGRMRQGGVKFDKESTWYPAFEQELLRFDKGEYKDQVDTIAWLGIALAEMSEAPTLEQLQDEEWEQEQRESMEFEQVGRSPTTGY